MKQITIIGAGILGAAVAYELSKKGAAVTLIESHTPGRATSASAGIICPWISKRRNMDWYTLAAYGARYYETLIPELKALGENDTGYKKVGALRLHEDIEKLKELEKLALKRREDSPEIGEVHILTPEETQARFPLLEEKYHSLSISGAARVDGSQLRSSLIQGAIHYGATWINGDAALQHQQSTVTGVEVNGEAVKSDLVIATNGAWMNRLLAPLSITLPFHVQKGEIVHMHTDQLETSNLPVVNPPNNQYLLSFSDGRIVAGATHETATSLTPALSTTGMHYLLEQGLYMAPGLAEASIVETRVGFRPFTYNHLPVFGSVPSISGLMVANGLGASGLTTGPYIAKLLAQMAADEEPDISVSPYKIELRE
ncbi:MAG TPA: FAD-dependent oxidoreductase [Pseudogracilibacillus sp.]|nr:FAD-dependent oxidoreductase [Pseudogracilibacillus sp.]